MASTELGMIRVLVCAHPDKQKRVSEETRIFGGTKTDNLLYSQRALRSYRSFRQ
jgi:hypothetical protein